MFLNNLGPQGSQGLWWTCVGQLKNELAMRGKDSFLPFIRAVKGSEQPPFDWMTLDPLVSSLSTAMSLRSWGYRKTILTGLAYMATRFSGHQHTSEYRVQNLLTQPSSVVSTPNCECHYAHPIITRYKVLEMNWTGELYLAMYLGRQDRTSRMSCVGYKILGSAHSIRSILTRSCHWLCLCPCHRTTCINY
jgi:hypothetical protein